jgi:predicted regulator of Ras-like GTPase activity (Roadblock/LC7/MglB family)
MLHSFICSNEEGYILMARYFSPKIGNTAKKSYEAELAQVCFQSSSVWERMKKDRMDQIISCQGQYVILRQIGELRLILSGNEEYDEVICELFQFTIAL